MTFIWAHTNYRFYSYKTGFIVVINNISELKSSAYDKLKMIPFTNPLAILTGQIFKETDRLQKSLKKFHTRSPASQNESPIPAVTPYAQKHYQLVDAEGDLELLNYTRSLPAKLIAVMTGQSTMGLKNNSQESAKTNDPNAEAVDPNFLYEAMPDPYATSDVIIEGRQNPVNRQGFRSMLLQVMVEERLNGIEPTAGVPHRWSPEFHAANNHGDSLFYLRFSKLLLALSSGQSFRFLRTDRELPLANWVLAQAQRSITPEMMFRKSYELNQGDIYLSLLTIENLLSRTWREPSRENLAITRRLVSVTNHYQGRGDNFGPWYHFFGTILYAYVDGEKNAEMSGRIENIGSEIIAGFKPKTQKGWMNRMGPHVGGDLRKIVSTRAWENFQPDPKALDFSNYITLNEDFRDRAPINSDPNLSLSLKYRIVNDKQESSLWIQSKSFSLKACQAEVMFAHANEGYDARKLKQTKNAFDLEPKINFDTGIKDSFPVENEVLRVHARVFLHCQNQELAVEN